MKKYIVRDGKIILAGTEDFATKFYIICPQSGIKFNSIKEQREFLARKKEFDTLYKEQDASGKVSRDKFPKSIFDIDK